MERKRHSRIWGVLLTLLLAVVCIAGVELAVCSVADPALFESITAPVRAAWNSAADRASEMVETARNHAEQRREARRLAALAAETAKQEAEQIAGEPAVAEEYVLADPAVTQLAVTGGQELLLGGNIPIVYYNQADATWASKPYGDDPIAIYGCGPTTMAMLVSSLTDTRINPAEMAVWCAENGYAAPQSGSFHSIVEGTAQAYGLNCVPLAGLDAAAVQQQLIVSGGVVVALMGPGHFTQGGHFILLHGATLTGDFLVADPNSRERSLTTWDPDIIMEELYPADDHGAPLWLITRGDPFTGDLASVEEATE